MPKVFSKRLFNQRGITLIELIAVILIIGIIAAVGIPVVFNQIGEAQDNADKANMAIVNDAVERYAIMNGEYVPVGTMTTAAELITFLQNVAEADGGPYLSQGVEITFDPDDLPDLRTDGPPATVIYGLE